MSPGMSIVSTRSGWDNQSGVPKQDVPKKGPAILSESRS